MEQFYHCSAFTCDATRIQISPIIRIKGILPPAFDSNGDNNANGSKSRWSMSRGACEDSEGSRVEGDESSKERRKAGGGLLGLRQRRLAITINLHAFGHSIYLYRPFILTIYRRLISAHIFLSPNKRSTVIPPLSFYFLLRRLSRNFAWTHEIPAFLFDANTICWLQ